jgi:hypothetical protein
VAALATKIAITTGDNPTLARAIEMTAMCGRSGVAPATTGKGQL